MEENLASGYPIFPINQSSDHRHLPGDAFFLLIRHDKEILTLAPTLKGCSKRYERFCQQYRHHAKGAPKCHWGSRMLKRLVETSGSKSKRISPGQQQLPFTFDLRLSQIPDDWHQIAVRFRRANGIRNGDREQSIW